MPMNKKLALQLLTFQIAFSCVPSVAEPLNLSRTPLGPSFKSPAPNVVITLDDSSSMGSPLKDSLIVGMNDLKAALRKTFFEGAIPDGSIRLAWQSLNACRWLVDNKICGDSEMRVYDEERRKKFLEFANSLTSMGNTPSLQALEEVGKYLKIPIDDKRTPWRLYPNSDKQDSEFLSCRRAYNIFMTDGGWNLQSNFLNNYNFTTDEDNTSQVFPDGTTYRPEAASSKIYRGSFGTTTVRFSALSSALVSTSFADLAFRYWATDLQPQIPDKVPSLIRQPQAENLGTTTLPPYWNPKNDVATWQHLTLYTIGFAGASLPLESPVFNGDTWGGPSYAALLTGTEAWPNPLTVSDEKERIPELWHAALNSRGKFIQAKDGDALANAFKDILSEIISSQTLPPKTLSASSRSARTDSVVFSSTYEAHDWSGGLTAYKIPAAGSTGSSTGNLATQPLWGINAAGSAKSTANIMDAMDANWAQSRTVFSSTDSIGIRWTWDNLSTAQRQDLQTDEGVERSEDLGRKRMAFLRGDRTEEGNLFRKRGSRQGDIANSKAWFVPAQPSSAYSIENYNLFRKNNASRPPVVYVGGNDGMLHGFRADADANTGGHELIAYVPEGLHAKLPALARPRYDHEYFVDGSPFSADIYLGEAGKADADRWRTYLAGFLGGGGKGYFVLDITKPQSFATASPEEIVVLDRTAAKQQDDDFGHIFSEPAREMADPMLTRQIARLNDGRWALIVGNGYNSRSEKAVLFIQYLDGRRELLKITADSEAKNGNGLSTPRLVDLNGDQVPDAAYAGDLHGNMWKFDLSSDKSAEWKVAFKGQPLAVARDASGTAQPITAAPVWKPHSKGGLMLAFATGRKLTDADRSSKNVQTIYGVYDNTPVKRQSAKNARTGTTGVTFEEPSFTTIARGELVQQTVAPEITTTTTTGSPLWTTSANPVDYSGATPKRGWYMDLPVSGERVLQNLEWFAANMIDVLSTVPISTSSSAASNDETCEVPDTKSSSYRTTLDIEHGTRPTSQIYGYADGFTSNGVHAGRSQHEGGVELVKPSASAPLPSGTACVTPGGSCAGRKYPSLVTLIPSWRQIQ